MTTGFEMVDHTEMMKLAGFYQSELHRAATGSNCYKITQVKNIEFQLKAKAGKKERKQTSHGKMYDFIKLFEIIKINQGLS